MTQFKKQLPPEFVEAEMFENTEEGKEKIATLLNLKVEDLDINNNGVLELKVGDFSSKVAPGDWVVKQSDDNVVVVIQPEEFDKTYQLV